jgi:hypothetical protein
MTPLTNRIAELQSEVATLTRERDGASQEAMQLYFALITLGITKGEVNKQERWWHARPDGSESIHENVMLAADALWSDYRSLAKSAA